MPEGMGRGGVLGHEFSGGSLFWLLLCCLVLGEFVRCELTALDVALVQFREVLPFLRQVVESENRRHRADGHAGTTVDALHGIDVELLNLVECRTTVVVGRVLLRVNAVNGPQLSGGGLCLSACCRS
jgi:hypothetical protein